MKLLCHAGKSIIGSPLANCQTQDETSIFAVTSRISLTDVKATDKFVEVDLLTPSDILVNLQDHHCLDPSLRN